MLASEDSTQKVESQSKTQPGAVANFNLRNNQIRHARLTTLFFLEMLRNHVHRRHNTCLHKAGMTAELACTSSSSGDVWTPHSRLCNIECRSIWIVEMYTSPLTEC